jgi:hypothetical protein
MIARACRAGIALAVFLAAAGPGLAASPPGHKPGRGSIGAAIGGSMFTADGDYSEGAKARFWFSAHFRYVFTPWLRGQFTPGYTWSSYDASPAPFTDLNFPEDQTKAEYLTQIVPATVQLQYTTLRGAWLYHAGAGGGLYRVWVENRRKVLKDPATYELHRAVYPGLTGEIGAAYYFKERPDVSVDVTTGADWVFAEDDEAFVSGWNSFILVNHLRVGINYHFDVGSAAASAESAPEVPAP